MTEYEVGEDLIIESDDLFNGRPFVAQFMEDGYSGSTLLVDTSDRTGFPERAQVHYDEVTALNELIRNN